MKRNRKTHPALTAFLITLTVLLAATAAFAAVWNTRAVLFDDATHGISLQQEEQGLQLRLFDEQYTLSPDKDSAFWRLLPPPVRAVALLLEAEADWLGQRLHALIR